MANRSTEPAHAVDFLRWFTSSWALVLVALAALIPYVALPANPLLLDAELAVLNESVQSGPIGGVFSQDFWGMPLDSAYSSRSYRPLVSLSYALQSRVMGNSPALFHTVDMLLHALCAVLVVLLARRFAVAAHWAVVAGLFYGLHPVQTEAVASVVGRADLCAVALLLIAMISQLKAGGGGRSWPWRMLTLLALMAAMLSKEYAVTFPFILIGMDLARGVGKRQKLADIVAGWGHWVAMLAVLAAYLSLRVMLIGAVGGVPMITAVDHPLYDAALTTRLGMALRLLLLVGRLLILPFTLNHHYRYGTLPVADGLFHPLALAGLGLLLLLVIGGWRLTRKYGSPLPLLAVVIGILPLIPVLNLISLSGVVFAERFLVLPVAGLALALAWSLNHFQPNARWEKPVLGVLLVVALLFIWQGYQRVGDWRSVERLCRTSLAAYPGSSEVWLHLGVVLGETGRGAEALPAFERSLEIQPLSPRAWHAYGVALVNQGRYADGAKAWRRAVELSPPELGRLWKGLGQAELLAGNAAASIDALEQARRWLPGDRGVLALGVKARLLAGSPADALAYFEAEVAMLEGGADAMVNVHGQILLRLAQQHVVDGRTEDALTLSERATGLAGLPGEAWFLAGLIAARCDAPSLATERFDRALEMVPDLLRQKHERASALQADGRYVEAAQTYEEILVAQPDHVQTLFNLALTLQQAGRPAEALEPLRRGLAIQDDTRARQLLTQVLAAVAEQQRQH
jgi:tetratricopeptide (TPR) repeat protein